MQQRLRAIVSAATQVDATQQALLQPPTPLRYAYSTYNKLLAEAIWTKLMPQRKNMGPKNDYLLLVRNNHMLRNQLFSLLLVRDKNGNIVDQNVIASADWQVSRNNELIVAGVCPHCTAPLTLRKGTDGNSPALHPPTLHSFCTNHLVGGKVDGGVVRLPACANLWNKVYLALRNTKTWKKVERNHKDLANFAAGN